MIALKNFAYGGRTFREGQVISGVSEKMLNGMAELNLIGKGAAAEPALEPEAAPEVEAAEEAPKEKPMGLFKSRKK